MLQILALFFEFGNNTQFWHQFDINLASFLLKQPISNSVT